MILKVYYLLPSNSLSKQRCNMFPSSPLYFIAMQELATFWSRRMAGQAASVGSTIGRCFSESRDVVSADGQNSLLGKEQENAEKP